MHHMVPLQKPWTYKPKQSIISAFELLVDKAAIRSIPSIQASLHCWLCCCNDNGWYVPMLFLLLSDSNQYVWRHENSLGMWHIKTFWFVKFFQARWEINMNFTRFVKLKFPWIIGFVFVIVQTAIIPAY